ncbi:MAG TPA: hypothetical protein VMW48_12765 [Vicinamibacterales bacterium]|nr:hypothetical protein [Vicinamibacterales bacterium]
MSVGLDVCKVAAIFARSLEPFSQADDALSKDWGLLDRFGTLLEKGQLEWPRTLTELRSAQSRAFQYVALQATVHLLSGPSGLSWLDIGVVDEQVKVKGKQDGRWSGMHYLTHSVHSKGGACGIGEGWYLREVYLGYRATTPGSSQPLPQDASDALQKKLFGHAIQDPVDPQFALPQGFRLSQSTTSRNGWRLPQLPFAS